MQAFLLTLAGWGVQAVMYWAFGRALGVDLSLADAVLVMIAASMIVSVHFVPTSIGIYEGTITGLLVAVGLSGGEALAYAIGTHLLLILFGIVTGGGLDVAAEAFDARPLRDGPDAAGGPDARRTQWRKSS